MHLGNDWLANPTVARVHAELQARGSRLFAVGGYVRDVFLGRPPGDLDLATDARPDTVAEVVEGLGCTVLPQGRQFGSVLFVDDTFQDLAITSFRQDIETDGRHATVVHTTEMARDARRRDFTINTLYLDDIGQVHDPTGKGLRDLKDNRVRFVGRPARRLHEDTLRVLRFFRFNGLLGIPRPRYDRAAMQAIQDCDRDRLAALSGSRVTREMIRVMQLADPVPVLEAMAEASVLAVFFPAADLPQLRDLVDRQTAWPSAAPELARLVLLGPPEPFPRLEAPRRLGVTLAAINQSLAHPHPIESAAYFLDRSAAIAVAQLEATRTGLGPPAALAERIAVGAAAHFPLTAADLVPRVRTEMLGRTLRHLRACWIASRFVLTRADLLARLDDQQVTQG